MIVAAKYVTEINQPGIFLIEDVNAKWYESLPKDLQHIVDTDAVRMRRSLRSRPRWLANIYRNGSPPAER